MEAPLEEEARRWLWKGCGTKYQSFHCTLQGAVAEGGLNRLKPRKSEEGWSHVSTGGQRHPTHARMQLLAITCNYCSVTQRRERGDMKTQLVSARNSDNRKIYTLFTRENKNEISRNKIRHKNNTTQKNLTYTK